MGDLSQMTLRGRLGLPSRRDVEVHHGGAPAWAVQAPYPELEPAVLAVPRRRIFQGEVLPLSPKNRLDGRARLSGDVRRHVDRLSAGIQVVRADLESGVGAGSAPRGDP